MDPILAAILLTALCLALMLGGVWLFATIIIGTAATLYLFLGFSFDRIGAIVMTISWRTVNSWELAAVPMYIWLGEIVFRTDIAQKLFSGLTPLVNRVPGQLLHTNVLGSTLFSALCGSSVATTATVGKITIPELWSRGYNRSLSVGSIAGAGTLGLLIPPSIILLVYGLVAELSILRLFAAGLIPGLMIAGIFMLYIVARALVGRPVTPARIQSYSVQDVLFGIWQLAPIFVLIVLVLGSLYSGFATPSESAAIGVMGALTIAAVTRQLSWEMVRDSGLATLRTSAMICTLLIGANFLSTAMAYLHVPQTLGVLIAQWGLTGYALIAVLFIVYVVLGTVLDGVALVVMTTPVVLPLVVDAGFHPIWFGVFLVLMAEMATISPPIGFNLFVLQNITGMNTTQVTIATVPFFLLMVLGCAILVVWPELSLWLPRVLYGL